MDERLSKALEFANYKKTLNTQRYMAKLKAERCLIFAQAGGRFMINQELIGFVDYLVRNNRTQAIILDESSSPIKIDDTKDFLEKITKQYFEVTNDLYTEMQSIKTSRNVKSILDIKDIQ